MGFLGIYKAIYDYSPQAEGELEISEGDLLYVLEKSSEDDWWKAKKKASAEDEEEPVGLIPNNYVEEAKPASQARALYEYTRQTDEELSFPEDARLDVYDTSDPDWILAGHDGDYGFVPANYIEMGDGDGQREEAEEEAEPSPPPLPGRSTNDVASPPLPARNMPSEPSSPAAPGPAAAIANVMMGRPAPSASSHAPNPLSLPPRPQYTPEDSEDDAKSPPLPARPRGESSVSAEHAYRSPPPERDSSPERHHHGRGDDYHAGGSGYGNSANNNNNNYHQQQHSGQTPRPPPGSSHMYNVNEMVSVMGKKKKMPTTLGINLKTGVIMIAPERTSDGPTQEWTADKMTHYSREGKHVFMELVKPSKSVDFHAGAKDTAEEIVSALGELAGAVRAEGLREVIMAGTAGHGAGGHKTGQMLYDFEAQGDDEVSVSAGDEVVILDDTKSEEWWQVRRLKNGKEGVVPSSYVEVTGVVPSSAAAAPPSHTGTNAGRSTVEQNRLEEERLTKEAVKAAQLAEQQERGKRGSEVGPGMRLPDRNSSLLARDGSNNSGQQRSRRENGRAEGSSSSRSKPDPSKVRTWTDRTKSFSVEAQFLGLKDNKINLHKLNGVKIAVPIAKMSVEDLEYIERITGISLDEDKPLSDLKKRSADSARASSTPKVGAVIEPPKKPEYDWFPFFLSCDVDVGLCQRYAQVFSRESMDESVLPDVDASVLRNLGLREGDIIKVMRFLDNKYGRVKKSNGDDGDGGGGLFSGPGGTLRNNTRKGRPAPAVQTSDVVDPKAFSQQREAGEGSKSSPTSATTPASSTGPSAAQKPSGGFDDDAWDVKPSKSHPSETTAPPKTQAPESAQPSTTAPAPAPKAVAQLTGSMQDLSLLTQPLEPVKVQPTAPQQPAVASPPPAPAPAAAPTAAPAQVVPQPTGATPSFFTGIPPPAVGSTQPQVAPGVGGAQAMPRQRPLAPQPTQGQGALMPPPPPSRPLSAPQSAQPSAFTPPPLQPQMTGNPSLYQQQQRIAPPGQSLEEINQARLQQQYAQQIQQQQQQMMMQPTGPVMAFPTGMPQPGFGGPNQFVQPMQASPFADPRTQQFSPVQAQPTGFAGGFAPVQPSFTGMPPPAGVGVNAFLPPPLEPQRTAMPAAQPAPQPIQPQPTGIPFTQGFGNHGLPPPPQQQQAPLQPLVPQKTGPPPPVRFGVKPDAPKLVPQATGRRANLAQATPDNPFGF